MVGAVPNIVGGNTVGVNTFLMKFEMIFGRKFSGAYGAVENTVPFEVAWFGQVHPFDL